MYSIEQYEYQKLSFKTLQQKELTNEVKLVEFL
jgi:hypothetical protein